MTVCHAHFEAFRHLGVKCPHRDNNSMCPLCYQEYRRKHDAYDAEVKACVDCQRLQKAEADRIQREDTIDPEQPWGDHINLVCTNHPNKVFHTKNISYIGARSIFFSGEWEPLPNGERRFKSGAMFDTDPVWVLKARLNGKNPYDGSDLPDEDKMTEWADVQAYVDAVNHQMLEYSFPCSCHSYKLPDKD